MTAYYNEIDPKAAAWLRELIQEGHLADGIVDERSIEDVRPDELMGYTQCHFFAGIGGWGYALRRAGWPDERPVWTGSCPCQPFSQAGAGRGTDDARHLWPAFRWLIDQCRPPVVLGEQVASKAGRAWFSGVRHDLEALGYAVGGADLCAAGVGAPHIRQRLYWVADADIAGKRMVGVGSVCVDSRSTGDAWVGFGGGCGNGGLADTEQHGSGREAESTDYIWPQADRSADQHGRRGGASGGLADAGDGSGQRCQPRAIERGLPASVGEDAAVRPSPTHGHWGDADWLFCRDGKWRPVEPGTFPLAHGLPARVGRLRGYGNAIVPQLAAEFVRAASPYEPERGGLGVADPERLSGRSGGVWE